MTILPVHTVCAIQCQVSNEYFFIFDGPFSIYFRGLRLVSFSTQILLWGNWIQESIAPECSTDQVSLVYLLVIQYVWEINYRPRNSIGGNY